MCLVLRSCWSHVGLSAQVFAFGYFLFGFSAFYELGQIRGYTAVLNLLLLLAETSSWKLAPGKALQVSVAGDSQTHKTAAAVVENQRSRGEEIQDNFQ